MNIYEILGIRKRERINVDEDRAVRLIDDGPNSWRVVYND